MKKFVVLLSVFALLAASFTGCGGSESERTLTDGKSFTYWATMDANSQRTLSSYSDMMLWQEMEKATGVHINFIHPIEGSTGNEAFIAMLSGGELPDMVEYNWSLYTGGPQQAIDDEVIISLDSYLKDHAPNFYNYTEGEYGKAHDYAYKLEATTDEGHYYGFNVLNLGETKGFAGIYVRADLLKKWGMDVPETIDEWTAVFAKAKAEGFSKPFTAHCDALSFKQYSANTFNTAYDVGKNLYLEGDKVVFGPLQPGFKEYLAQIAEWSKAGYIDHGFVTAEGDDVQANMTNGNSIAGFGYVGSALGTILPAAQERIPGYDLVACPYPVLKKGDVARFQGSVKAATPHAIGITVQCGNYEKAIEWCDYLYSEDGMELQLFGIEGDTYTVEEKDGEKFYTYTDKILDFKENGFNSIEDSLYHYMLPCNHPGYNQHRDYLDGFYQLDRQKEAIKVWNKWADESMKYILPTLSFTEEEARENTDILEIAQTNLDVAVCDIILGRRDVSTYDDAIAQAKEEGIEKYIANAQSAYDRYLAKMK